MTERVPTPYQYLLDVDCKIRIDKAKASGDATKIANAIKYFGDLKETEVVFGPEIWVTDPFKPDVGYWKTSYLCAGRKFKIDPIKYTQGTVQAMLMPHARPNTLDWSNCRLPGFYFNKCDNVNNLCLLYRKDIDIYEALKFSGFEFDPLKSHITTYPGFNGNLNANGHIDIEYSFVKGRIYFAYQTVFFDPDDPRNPYRPDPVASRMMSVEEAPVVEEQPPVTEEKAQVTETPKQEETPVEETPPKEEVVAKPQVNNKKNR